MKLKISAIIFFITPFLGFCQIDKLNKNYEKDQVVWNSKEAINKYLVDTDNDVLINGEPTSIIRSKIFRFVETVEDMLIEDGVLNIGMKIKRLDFSLDEGLFINKIEIPKRFAQKYSELYIKEFGKDFGCLNFMNEDEQ